MYEALGQGWNPAGPLRKETSPKASQGLRECGVQGIYLQERQLVIPERMSGKEKEIMSLPPNFVSIIDLRQ